ncbi:MAG: polysaccharide deacetylase family protein [Filimonas sp.]|nr:polysaccharide deacetylase family protein [Filimonas sp.]
MKRASFIVPVAACAIIAAALFSCKGKNAANDKTAKDSTKTTSQALVPGGYMKLDSSKRYIFLTFDDSPQPPGTTVCKAIFHANGVKATFFAVGMHQFDYYRKMVVDSIRNAYPEFLLANHSYSHGFQNNYKKFYASPDSAVSDFIRAEAEMKVPVKIIRLPGNNSWVFKGAEMKGPKSTMQVCKRLDSLGYSVVGWDIEWQFVGGSKPKQSVEEMLKEVNNKFDNMTSNYPNTVVILAHDRMFAKQPYSDSLNKFIGALKADPRNAFETIDHYPLIHKK